MQNFTENNNNNNNNTKCT